MEDKKQQTEEALKGLFSDSMLSFIPETNNRADMIQPNINQSTESSDVANPESSNNLNVNVNITQNLIQREVERAVEGILNTTSNPAEVKKNYIGNYQEGNISSNFISAAPTSSGYDTKTTVSSPIASPTVNSASSSEDIRKQFPNLTDRQVEIMQQNPDLFKFDKDNSEINQIYNNKVGSLVTGVASTSYTNRTAQIDAIKRHLDIYRESSNSRYGYNASRENFGSLIRNDTEVKNDQIIKDRTQSVTATIIETEKAKAIAEFYGYPEFFDKERPVQQYPKTTDSPYMMFYNRSEINNDQLTSYGIDYSRSWTGLKELPETLKFDTKFATDLADRETLKNVRIDPVYNTDESGNIIKPTWYKDTTNGDVEGTKVSSVDVTSNIIPGTPASMIAQLSMATISTTEPSPEPPATVNNSNSQEKIGLYSYTPPSQKQVSTIDPNDEDAMYKEYLAQQAKQDVVVEALAIEQSIINSTGNVVAAKRSALDALMFSKINNSTNTSTARQDTVYQTISTPLQYTNLTPSREWTNDDLNNPFYAANPSAVMDKIYPDQTGSDYIRQQLGMDTPNQVSFDRGSGAEIITRFPPTDTQRMAEEIYRDNINLYSRQDGGGVAFHSMDAYISNNNPVYGKPSDNSLYGMRYVGGDDPRIEKVKIQSFGSGYGTNEHGVDTYVENQHMSQQEFFVNQEPTEDGKYQSPRLVRTPRQPEITVLETFRPLRPDQKQENDFGIRTPGTPTYNDAKFHEYYNNFILQDANDELERKREEIKRSVEVRRQEIEIEKAREKQTAPVPFGLSPESPQPSPPQAPIDLQAVSANYNVDQLNTDTTNQTNVDSISYLNETEYANDPKTKPPVVNTTELYSSTQQVTNSPPVTNVVDNSVQNTSNIINNLYSSNSNSTSSILNSANNLRADMQTTSQNAQRWAEDNLGKTPEQREFDSLPPELQAAEKEKRFITVTQDNGERKLQDLQSEVPKLMTTQDVVSASESIGKQTQRNIAAGRSLQQRWAEEDKQRFIERYGQEAWDKASQQGSQYAENTFNEYKTNQLNSTHNNQNLSVEAQEFERQQQRDFERWDKGEIGDVKREGEYGAVESTTQVTSRTDSVLRQSERAGTAIQNSLDQINELQISSDFISSNETQSNQNISVEPVQNQFNTNVTNSTNIPESIVNTEVTEQPNSSVTTTSTTNTSNNPVNVQNNTTTNVTNLQNNTTSNTSNNPVNVQNNTTTNISNGVNVVTNNISSDTSYDTVEEIRAGKGFGGNNPTGNTTNITNNIDELADTYTPSKIEFLSPDQMFEQFLNMNTSNISGDSMSFAEDNEFSTTFNNINKNNENSTETQFESTESTLQYVTQNTTNNNYKTVSNNVGQTNIKYETAPTSNVVNNFNTTNYTSSQQVTSNNTYSPIRSGADVNTSYTNVTNNQTQQMYVNNDDMSKNITNSLESYFDATYSTRISTISKSSTTNMFTENVKNTIQDMLIEKGLDKDPFIKTDIQRNQRNMEISMEDPLDFKMVEPGDTKNIYESMMVFDPDINVMIKKINSPPIWRTAIG